MKKKNLPDVFMKGVTFKGNLSPEQAKTRAARKFMTPISQAELACRICEAVLGIERPDGDTPEQALDRMDEDAREQWLGAADAVMGYFKECIMNASEPH